VGLAKLGSTHLQKRRIMLLRKITVLLAALSMMMVMSVPPAMAHHDVGHVNNGHKADDSADADEGGGNDHIKQNNGKGND
jgi:hypothetical protein